MSEQIHISADQEEMLPITDTEGNVIGSAWRSECHNGSHLIHPVVHVHIYNSKGEIYLQKRSMAKKFSRANGIPPWEVILYMVKPKKLLSNAKRGKKPE